MNSLRANDIIKLQKTDTCFDNIHKLFHFYDEFLWIHDYEKKLISQNSYTIHLQYALKDYDSIDNDLDYDEQHYAKICDEFEKQLYITLKCIFKEKNMHLTCPINEIVCERWKKFKTDFFFVLSTTIQPVFNDQKLKIFSYHYE